MKPDEIEPNDNEASLTPDDQEVVSDEMDTPPDGIEPIVEASEDAPDDEVLSSINAEDMPIVSEAEALEDEIISADDELAHDEQTEDEPVNDYSDYDYADEYESDYTDDFDIESALAAVSQLHDLTEPDEMAEPEISEAQRVDTPEDLYTNAEQTSDFVQPGFSTLYRGQAASVVPAVILIGLGIWLTLTTTTSDTPLNPVFVGCVLLTAVGVMFISRWVSTNRWDAGILFTGLSFIAIGGITAVLIQLATLTTMYPFIVVGVGVAFVLTAWLSRLQLKRLMLTGLALIVGGIAGYLLTTIDLEPNLNTLISNVAPIVLVVLLVLSLIPILPFKRR